MRLRRTDDIWRQLVSDVAPMSSAYQLLAATGMMCSWHHIVLGRCFPDNKHFKDHNWLHLVTPTTPNYIRIPSLTNYDLLIMLKKQP